MFEFMACSLLTLVPDYLFRRYYQGKRIGVEITLFSMWYELRYGITACLILTISVITTVFYFHPATSNVTSAFRTVTILPTIPGRVVEVYVENNQEVEAGDPLFKIDDTRQRAAVNAAVSRVSELEATLSVGQSQLRAAEGALSQAESVLTDVQEEFDLRNTLLQEGSPAVSEREVETLANQVAEAQGAFDAARANRDAVRAEMTTLIPAQIVTANANLVQAQADLDDMIVYAGTEGTIEQFALQEGDYVSSLLRPAGILVPPVEQGRRFQAGFDQISAQVIEPGMIGEITCNTLPFVIVPMVVTDVQDVIAAGQFRPTDTLIDIQRRDRASNLTVFMEPLYEGQIERIPPGSRCAGNVYTSNHERIHNDETLSGLHRTALHAIDATGVIHAAMLRLDAIRLPIFTLVLSGGH
ncbi:MAG: biotin/lipoyl-binding protein [Pseudomonadota bacterium]